MVETICVCAHHGNFKELSYDDWEHGVKLLLMSAVLLTKRVITGMTGRSGDD